MVVQPGQALTIGCKVSGYSLTDNSYCTNWIRHATGENMQWIGYICSSGSTGYTDSLKNRFSITQDTSSNTVTLQGQNVQMEDTAVYYCVRYRNTVICITWVPVQKPLRSASCLLSSLRLHCKDIAHHNVCLVTFTFILSLICSVISTYC